MEKIIIYKFYIYLGSHFYLKKVKELRKRVADLQKEKSDSLKNIAKLRNDAKNKLIKAESDLLQAKYDYLFKIKILDFFMGNPLTL